MNRKKPTKIALTKPMPLSRWQEWKKIFPLLGIILLLFSGAACLRIFLTSQKHTQIGGPYALVNGQGQIVTQAAFGGHYTLLYFGYTHCVDICPLTLATVSAALDELGKRGESIIPVFISVDPERDTPKVLQDYVERFSPRIVGLTGSEAQLQSVVKAFHVSARRQAPNGSGYLIDHSSLLYFMDGQNHLVGMIPVDASAHQIASELRRLLPPS
ncbi:SCO family protein [Acetobacter fabarum]|uniref:Electron transporter SenC n=1 Tax=Acetobacter fabarum TaxID=483199 RepID=A0A269XYK8_9PROT|nr:SCO family protein [Acetobacter fabarum]PAK78397.1 electron transporter SenC [Acetobacter fabarum]PEN27559.1 SCO family protein [Acetobacter fabarum]